MKPKPKRKNAPGQGRKPEGRTRICLFMRPEAIGKLDARIDEQANTRGKVVERLIAC